jgi:hydroxypyruvate isomerase
MFTQAMGAAAFAATLPRLQAESNSAADPARGQFAADREPEPAPDPEFGLSVMLWTVWTDLPFEQRLANVARVGYKNVELVGEYRKWSDADFARANAARKSLGIRFDATAGLSNGVSNPATADAFLAELRQALKPMETLGCPAMIVLSGDVIPGLTREEQHQASIETLKRAASLVEGRKIEGQPVRLLLECIHVEERPKYFMTSALEAIDVVRAVNHPQVQFLYDIYHEQMGFGNLIEKLDKHIDVIGLIHVADVPGRHDPGSGEINYRNIFRKLARLNYRRNVAMEFLPSGDPVAALRAAKTLALAAGTA